MSDRLPGSSWDNPIWYNKWRIYLSDDVEIHGYEYEYVHDDFDGAPDAGDSRCGIASSVKAAIVEIRAWEAEHDAES